MISNSTSVTASFDTSSNTISIFLTIPIDTPLNFTGDPTFSPSKGVLKVEQNVTFFEKKSVYEKTKIDNINITMPMMTNVPIKKTLAFFDTISLND